MAASPHQAQCMLRQMRCLQAVQAITNLVQEKELFLQRSRCFRRFRVRGWITYQGSTMRMLIFLQHHGRLLEEDARGFQYPTFKPPRRINIRIWYETRLNGGGNSKGRSNSSRNIISFLFNFNLVSLTKQFCGTVQSSIPGTCVCHFYW